MIVLKRFGLGVALISCCLLGTGVRGYAQDAPPENQQGVQVPAPEAPVPEAPAPAMPAPEITAPETPDLETADSAQGEEDRIDKELLSQRPVVEKSLMEKDFSYPGSNMLDPFISFIAPAKRLSAVGPPSEEEGELPPEAQRPMTPLQKMTLSEIERGLRAILWGEMGRKAVIEDAAGKGFIVSVGTPAGDNKGVITQIFNDRLVIQQEIWEGETKRMVPVNTIVKLKRRD